AGVTALSTLDAGVKSEDFTLAPTAGRPESLAKGLSDLSAGAVVFKNSGALGIAESKEASKPAETITPGLAGESHNSLFGRPVAGAQNLAEEFRADAPVQNYAFGNDSKDHFGANGFTAVESAVAQLGAFAANGTLAK